MYDGRDVGAEAWWYTRVSLLALDRLPEPRADDNGHEEEDEQDSRVPHDGTERDDEDADKRAGRRLAVLVRNRLDEHVGDDEEDGHGHWLNDLGEEHRAPTSARHVARQLLGWVAELLLLVTGNVRARETTVTDP